MEGAAGDDEDDDYMSDAFLAKCVPADVRPGLKRSHSKQREHDQLKKKQELEEAIKSAAPSKRGCGGLKAIEAERRDEGLQTSLDSTNRGFAMLQKMGYESGKGLGKTGSGIVEPVPIELKCNRFGLGREDAAKKILEVKAKFRLRHREDEERRRQQTEEQRNESAKEFRDFLSKQHRTKKVERDLFNSQKACRQLDLAKGFKSPLEPWFWPPAPDADGEAVDDNQLVAGADDDDEEGHRPAGHEVRPASDDSQDSDREDDDRVVEVDSHSEDDDDDDDDDVGGTLSNPDEASPTKPQSKHSKVSTAGGRSQASAPDAEHHEEAAEFSPEETLAMITEYLRSQYLYCLWCGTSFSDPEDLSSSCPGATRDDHD